MASFVLVCSKITFFTFCSSSSTFTEMSNFAYYGSLSALYTIISRWTIYARFLTGIVIVGSSWTWLFRCGPFDTEGSFAANVAIGARWRRCCRATRAVVTRSALTSACRHAEGSGLTIVTRATIFASVTVNLKSVRIVLADTTFEWICCTYWTVVANWAWTPSRWCFN